MMNFIMVPAIMAIITVGIYKLFELFVCKKERLMLIEKMGDKYEPDVASIPRFHSNYSFSALTKSFHLIFSQLCRQSRSCSGNFPFFHQSG